MNNGKVSWKTILPILVIVIGLVGTITGYIYAEGTSSRNRDQKITEDYSREDIEIRKEQSVVLKETNIKLGEIMLALGRVEGKLSGDRKYE